MSPPSIPKHQTLHPIYLSTTKHSPKRKLHRFVSGCILHFFVYISTDYERNFVTEDIAVYLENSVAAVAFFVCLTIKYENNSLQCKLGCYDYIFMHRCRFDDA